MSDPLVKWEPDKNDKLRAWASDDAGKTWNIIFWYPQPGSQSLFLGSCIRETFYEGPRGGGKTDTLLMDFAQHVGQERYDKHGNKLAGFGRAWRGILFRESYPQLLEVVTKSFEIMPHFGGKYNAAEHSWKFPTGEYFKLAYISHVRDCKNHQGHEWPWMGFEELPTWHDSECYTTLFACNRSPVTGLPLKIRATGNPYGPGHNWVKDRFQLPMPHHISPLKVCEVNDDELPRCAIHSHLHENKILLHAQPDYIKTLISTANGNQAKLRAWIHGDWDVVAGGMFDDVWDHSVHVVPTFNLPKSWRFYRCFDWGSSAPFAVLWFAESDGSDYRDSEGRLRSSVRGDLFLFGEWYGWNGQPNKGCNMLAVDIAKGIIERELNMNMHESIRAGPADSAIFNVENGVSIAVDMMRAQRIAGGKRKIKFVPADKRPGSRVHGWELMRKRFMAAKPNESGTPREHPGMFVFDHCHQFIRTIPGLPRDEKKMDDVDTQTEDHIADAARYMVRYVGRRMTSGHTVGGAF